MLNHARLIRTPSARSHFDGLFSQWGAISSGLVVLVLAAGTFRKTANSRAEVVLGIEAALVTFLVTAIFGVLARQLHEAASRAELRTRHWEYLSYPAGLALLVVGLWQLSNLGVGEAGMLLALLLLLAACLATISLGILSSLVSRKKGRD
jgi:Na+/H+ antiporter NhaD/arsenite permease-like protein